MGKSLLGKLSFGLSLLAFTGNLWAVDIPFDNGTNVDTSTNRGFSVNFADLDRDGDQDLLSAVSTPGNVLSWWENTNGLGTAYTERTIITAWTGATSVETGDVDGDGDLDVLACAFDLGDVVVYRNDDGVGTTWTALNVDLAVPGPRQAVFADLDRDGDLDVVGASNSTGTKDVSWWENTAGDGSAWTPHTIDTTMNGARSVRVGDIDADGDPDVVASAEFDDKVVFYENTAGTGLVWTETVVNTALFDGGSTLTLGDFDGDGDLDIAGVAEAASNVVCWRNTAGDGSAWTEVLVSPSLAGAYGIASADVDADGDLDLVTAARTGLRVDWWENTAGDASAWTGHLVESFLAGNAGRSVAVGDINGDGLIDIAANLDSRLEVYRNESIHRSLTFPTRINAETSSAGAFDVKIADIDRDGDSDLVGVGATDDEAVFYENTVGDGSVFVPTSIATGLDGATAIATGDIDRDGKLDVVAAAETAGDLIFYRNSTGDGSTWTPTTIDAAFLGAKDVVIADIDGDGDLDVAGASPGGDEIAFYRNANGDGSVWNKISAGTFFVDAAAVAVGDLDEDGDLDLVGAAPGDDDLAWFENTLGNGSAWSEHTIANTFDGATDVELADVDSDGDLDVVAAGEVADDVAWFENIALAFTEHTIDGAFDGARGIAVADIDLDGNVDVVGSRGNGTGQVQAYRNTLGTGLAWTPLSLTTTFAGGARLTVGDVDSDGRLDVVAAAATDGDIAFFRHGGGQAALPTTNVSPVALGNNITDDVLKITLEHRGKVGENGIELAALELRFEDGAQTALTTSQANGVIENLRLFLDDGNGISDGGDIQVQEDTSLSLTDGVHTMSLVDNDVNLAVDQGFSKTYFVVVQTTATYTSQPLSFFRIVHLTQATSRVEDRPNDATLRLEYLANVASNLFQVNPSSESADLELQSVSDSPDPVVAGTQLTYTVTLANNGPSAAQNVSVSGALPSGTTLVSTSGCSNDPTGSPTCQLGTVPASSIVSFDITVSVSSAQTSSLSFTATATSTTPEAAAGDESASATTTVTRQGDLVMSLTQPPRDYVDGAPITYRITITNDGPSDSTNAAVTDTFPAILTGVSWTCSGTGGSTCPASGVGNLAAVAISVKAGQSVTFVATGLVPDGQTAVISNSASVTDSNDPVGANNAATVNSPWSNPIFIDGFEIGSTASWSADFP